MEENGKKVPTIEELQKAFDDYKKEKDEEVKLLKSSLEEEKRKVAQFSIMGITKKVETKTKDDEPVTFDFDF